ncbi:MAG: hypothetical protein IPP14_08865 [Planctomycetes bacterium]|nr:hypothetical protein [Planctomycetota bacterium]
MSNQTKIFIDGEHAATLFDVQHDEPWHYGNLAPAEAFSELLGSLETAPWSTNQEGAVELVAGQDTVDRVSWGQDVDSSEMITKLTLARFATDGQWELEFTCESENSESGAAEPEESAA